MAAYRRHRAGQRQRKLDHVGTSPLQSLQRLWPKRLNRSDDSLTKLREKIHAKFDGVTLQYDARIESVDWLNDLATIKTRSPIRKYKPSARLPFNITTTQPIVIPMSREEAGGLQTRKPLVFRGTLSFQDGKYGAVGRPPTSQSIFWIRSEHYKQVISIGTFITEDYSVSLGDDEIFAIHPEQEAG